MVDGHSREEEQGERNWDGAMFAPIQKISIRLRLLNNNHPKKREDLIRF